MRLDRWPALTVAVVLAVMCGRQDGYAQPCNPVIDGTYCASQTIRSSPTSRPLSVEMTQVQSIANDLSLGKDQPGTFGAVTFRGGGSRCVGLLRRGACN
jgi:hypothetical protein